MGAVSFIETMDHTSLSNIDKEEFEKYVFQLISCQGADAFLVKETSKMPFKPSLTQTQILHSYLMRHLMSALNRPLIFLPMLAKSLLSPFP